MFKFNLWFLLCLCSHCLFLICPGFYVVVAVVVSCWLLFVVVLFAVCCLMLAVRCLLFAVCCVLVVGLLLMFVVCSLFFVLR